MLQLLFLGAVLAASPPQSDTISLVRPYLEELIAATNDEFNAEGVFLGASPHRRRADEAFERLLGNDTPTGDRVLAYLLFLYNGEHPGEELVCEVARRGRRMMPLIQQYSSKLPVTGLEPLPKFVQGSGYLARLATEMIEKGEKCDPDQ